jgi:hypothetical protein
VSGFSHLVLEIVLDGDTQIEVFLGCTTIFSHLNGHLRSKNRLFCSQGLSHFEKQFLVISGIDSGQNLHSLSLLASDVCEAAEQLFLIAPVISRKKQLAPRLSRNTIQVLKSNATPHQPTSLCGNMLSVCCSNLVIADVTPEDLIDAGHADLIGAAEIYSS